MDRLPVINGNRACDAGHPPGPYWQGPTQVQKRCVRTVLTKPGGECSPDLSRGLRRVSESAPISRRRGGLHRRCNRPTRGGDSIYHNGRIYISHLLDPVRLFWYQDFSGADCQIQAFIPGPI
jgi:hypothetical protein